MIIGIPKEIKNHEYRVGMTPEAVQQTVSHGHQVIVQMSAGIGLGIGDEKYKKAGAQIAKTAPDIFKKSGNDCQSQRTAGRGAQNVEARAGAFYLSSSGRR